MHVNRKIGQIRSASQIHSAPTDGMGMSAGHSLHFAGASCIGNTLLGLGKLIMGILSLSLFTCANALYTLGMVAAKCFALAGVVKKASVSAQYRYCKWSGMILIASSSLYIGYSVRLFLYPVTTVYHMYTALAIAAFTFAELGINIRGIVVYRHSHMALVHAIKMINLASSLICLVLTQAAILSFAETATPHIASVNGVMGILMGSAAILIGVIMIRRITRIQKQKTGGQPND